MHLTDAKRELATQHIMDYAVKALFSQFSCFNTFTHFTSMPLFYIVCYACELHLYLDVTCSSQIYSIIKERCWVYFQAILMWK